MIKLKNVSVKYVKDYYSLYNVNLEIDGNTLLIGGESSGNNFLLRILAKIDKNYEGEIFVDNVNLKQIKDKDLNLAYIPKTPYLFENKSVLENLIYPLKIRKINKKEAILCAKTAIKPYFLKIFEISNKTNSDKIQKEKIKINEKFNTQDNNLKSNKYNKSYNDKGKLNFNKEKFESYFESSKMVNINLTQKGKQPHENLDANVTTLHLTNEEFKENFEKFLNTKVKKLDLSTKKIITLLRAKIREPKYVLIENFFENLDKNFFNLTNQIISNLKTTSTIIATQNDKKILPANNNFEQIFFDAGIAIKQKNNY